MTLSYNCCIHWTVIINFIRVNLKLGVSYSFDKIVCLSRSRDVSNHPMMHHDRLDVTTSVPAWMRVDVVVWRQWQRTHPAWRWGAETANGWQPEMTRGSWTRTYHLSRLIYHLLRHTQNCGWSQQYNGQRQMTIVPNSQRQMAVVPVVKRSEKNDCDTNSTKVKYIWLWYQ